MKQETALNLLKAGENVFLTGSAGAGKTYTLNQYIQYLRERNIPVAITASTGIAATHMGGMTIHSWAGIGIKDELTDKDIERMKDMKYLENRFEKVKVLIIDEISMLHFKQFNLVNQVLKSFKDPNSAFGGIQIVVSGDFFQLPPVGSPKELNREKFCFMSNAWVEAKFKVCYLTEQHRQGNDPLNDILNAVREQSLNAQHFQLLESCRNQDIGDTFTQLYTHNADVDSLNNKQLRDIEQEEYYFMSEVSGNAKLIETLKSSVQAPDELVLKKTAKVMFVKNNFDVGYVNGSLGEIIDFIKEDEICYPLVRLLDGEVITAEPATWTIENEANEVLASYTQIPLRLAWAITIHKSQGMTLDAAKIDLSNTFSKGQGYVALSRLKSLNGLDLLGLGSNALELDSLAMKADRRFQELSSEAEQQFADMDLSEKHLQFIKYCGGISDIKQIQQNKTKALSNQNSIRIATLEQTKELFEKGFDIVEIADERGLTISTIINHLEKLHRNHGLNIDAIRPEQEQIDQVRKIYKKIQRSNNPEYFSEDGNVKLRPIVELSSPALSYDEVRLALLFVV